MPTDSRAASAQALVRLCVHWPRLGPYHLARLSALSERLTLDGHNLVALETAGRDMYDWSVQTAPTPYERVTVFPNSTFADLSGPDLYRGVTSALDTVNPDAVAINSYSAPDALAALAWCRRHGRIAVCMTDSTADDALRHVLREHAKGLLVREFDAALAAGTRTVHYLESLGFPPSRVFTPYDVVDNAAFATPWVPRPDLPGLADPQPFFLASNRFVARKNVAGIVRGYARYRASGGTWRLVLLGDGPERVLVEALVETEGIPGVTFAGFQQIEELPAYYAAAGAFVHAALVDQWGLVINEAMAAACPVIVSERAGAAEDLVIEGVTGFQFDPTDSDALARLLTATTAMSEAERLEMGRRARAHVAAWSPERFAEALWDAVEAGRQTSRRGLGPGARALLLAYRIAARRSDSFHAIRD